MKILVIGQTSSFLIKEYIQRALDSEKDEIYVLYDSHYGEDVKKEYEKKGIHLIITDKGVPFLGRIPKVRTLVNLYYHISRICSIKKFDIIEFQGMPTGKIAQFFAKFILKYAEKVICMYWGSDLLATSVNNIKNAEGCLKKATYIIFDSNNLKDKFHEIFGKKYDTKFVNTRLGTSIFDELAMVMQTKSIAACKAHFGLPENKKVIAVGYNGRKRQQHMQVLEQLATLERKELNEIAILLHFGYSIESEEYRNEIEEYVVSHFPNYKIIDQFLDKQETAMLRVAVDIFIHAQISDALAGSVKEYLYAETLLLNPEWIHYSECDELGVFYLNYRNWDEIPSLMRHALGVNMTRLRHNRTIMETTFSWEAVKKEWDRVHYG